MERQEITGAAPVSWRVLQPHAANGEKARLEFSRNVLLGLSRTPKSIPSRYFYDEEGNRLFQRIMDLPEYYLTDCEMEILVGQRERIADHVGGRAFNLVELGAGDGKKTKVLLEHFKEQELDFKYVPIDICEPALVNLVEHCGQILPGTSVEGLVSEYFDGLRWLSGLQERCNVVLFLGSNIGNFSFSESEVFLHSLWNSLNDGDLVLIGFDLKKDIEVMLRAYNDAQGVTAQFNLNLLRRINRELGGNFQEEQFEHYSAYDVFSGAMASYLVSRTAQTVHIKAVGRDFAFAPLEPIHTEVSQKFLPSDIAGLAEATGFEIIDQLTDSRNYFIDSLWTARKACPAAS